MSEIGVEFEKIAESMVFKHLDNFTLENASSTDLKVARFQLISELAATLAGLRQDVLREWVGESASIRELFGYFGGHKDDCEGWDGTGPGRGKRVGVCTCGFASAFNRAAEFAASLRREAGIEEYFAPTT